ncbi:GGDEF domain-containing protein [Fulvimarina sp. MAC8]|uniref:GGDEF domain-containing protein n=1 Tax=Fulvimarina sp. MAC8 TaxID=3162874 RepID=UPI0032EF26B3
MIRSLSKTFKKFDRLTGTLLVATIACAGLAIATSVRIQMSQRKIVEIANYNLEYSYARTQIEIMRLQGAVRDIIDDGPSVSKAELQLSILAGRLETIPTRVGPLEFPESVKAREDLRTSLTRIEPLLPLLSEKDRARAVLDHLDERVRDFTRLGALANSRQSQLVHYERQILTSTMVWLNLYLLLLVGTGLVLLVIVFRQRRNLARIAVTDPLTGLANRAAIQGWTSPTGRETNLALAIVDVDHFKSINDEFGHAAGDDLLRLIADILKRHAGEGNLPARLGGDEFIVIFLGTDAECEAHERCAAIAETFRREARLLGFTKTDLSIGIATGCAGTGDDLPPLMHEADAAMYEAKQGGGNGRQAGSDEAEAGERGSVLNLPLDRKDERGGLTADQRLTGTR